MEEERPADPPGRRREAEEANLIAALISLSEFLEENLDQAIKCTGVPADPTRAKMMLIYGLLKIIKMGGPNMHPRYRLASALIAIVLRGVKCGLLMYVLFGVVSWPIVMLYVLLTAFAFIAT